MSVNQQIAWIDFSKPDSNRDLILKVEETEFWVSRKELADLSPVFKSMLYGQFQEAKQDAIQLPGKKAAEVLEVLRCLFPVDQSMDEEEFEEDSQAFGRFEEDSQVLQALRFLFSTNRKPKEVDGGNLEILLKFADEYEIESLTEKCSKFFIEFVKEKGCPEKEKEIMKYFVVGSRYKKFVRDVLHVFSPSFSRIDVANALQHGDDLPAEVRYAILLPSAYQKFEQEFDLEKKHRIWCSIHPFPWDWDRLLAYYCKICKQTTCFKCFDNYPGGHRCRIARCRNCSKVFGETGIFCECIDPRVIAELEKVGL